MKSGIYSIRNRKNNKMYIGSAVNIKRRWQIHLNQLNNGNHHSRHLQKSWDLYGEESFIFEILEKIEDHKYLLEREQYYMDFYDSYNIDFGYNIQLIAGSPLGVKKGEEAKKNLSKIWKKKYDDGYKHPMLGKKHTKETIEKQSNTKKEKYKKEKHPMLGKKHTKETIEKLKGKNSGKNSAMYGKKGIDHPTYGKQLRGNKHPNYNKPAKNAKSLILIMENGNKKDFKSIEKCSKYLEVSRSTIRNYINGKTKKCEFKIIIKNRTLSNKGNGKI